MLHVLEPNINAARPYPSAGFLAIGVRRNSALWDGERCNKIIMDAIP